MRTRGLLTRQGYAARSPSRATSSWLPLGLPSLVCSVNDALQAGNHATKPAPAGWIALSCPHGVGSSPRHPPASHDASTAGRLRAEAAGMNDLLVARLSAQGGLVTA